MDCATVVDLITPQLQAAMAASFDSLPDETRLRLAGLEKHVRDILVRLHQELWRALALCLQSHGEKEGRKCTCGRRRHRQRCDVQVQVLGLSATFACAYYYCRHCHSGDAPVRRFLGIESGDSSLAFARALTALSSKLTFGETVIQMQEQHQQEVDRTKAERVTYEVGRQAQQFLAEKRKEVQRVAQSEGRHDGVTQLQLTADGGGIPVGELHRPASGETKELTAKRSLPKATRTIAAREARLTIVRQPESTERMVDCHIAPLEQPAYSGERMYATALLAGLGDETHIHGVFDMGTWIRTQFEEQFAAYPRSAVADIYHVAEYLCAAGKNMAGEQGAEAWGKERKHWLLLGELDKVLGELQSHTCGLTCLKDAHGKCLARVAEGYLSKFRRYMNYPPVLEQHLPVGSGEAESGIRHLIRRRMDVAGAWREDNADAVLALVAVRASDLWEEFWKWRDEQDLDLWRKRQRGEIKAQFRGNRRTAKAA